MNKETQKFIETRTMGLDVLLTKHCNLRCRGCSRYSNIAKPFYYDIDYLIKDIKKIKETNIKVTRLTFTGGEPLLYPTQWLKEILKLSRELFPDAGISIFTNGKDLLKTNLWDFFHDYHIGITYTKYVKSNIDYDAIVEKAKEKEVLCNNLIEYTDTVTTCEEKTWMFLPKLSKNIKGNLRDKLKYCTGNCPVLWDSKIFLCGTSAFVDTLNKHFRSTFKVCKEDYIPVDELTLDKFITFISNLTPFCRYCCNAPEEKIEWSQSKPKKEDYIE